MALASGKIAEEFGDEVDLLYIGCPGDGATRKVDFKAGAIRGIGHLRNEECGRAPGASWRLRLACRDPGGECGILDAALRGEDGRTE